MVMGEDGAYMHVDCVKGNFGESVLEKAKKRAMPPRKTGKVPCYCGVHLVPAHSVVCQDCPSKMKVCPRCEDNVIYSKNSRLCLSCIMEVNNYKV